MRLVAASVGSEVRVSFSTMDSKSDQIADKTDSPPVFHLEKYARGELSCDSATISVVSAMPKNHLPRL